MHELLTNEDQVYFKKWIELNLAGISWEGRYQQDFDNFWNRLFCADTSIQEQFAKFDEILKVIAEGPLIAWIKWLREKLICYVFLYKNQSLEEIALKSQLSSAHIATICRDFFVERYPHLEEQINERFQIGNKLSENLKTDFSLLKSELDLSETLRGSVENEIMTGLEITLYSDWAKLKNVFGNTENIQSKKASSFILGSNQKFKFFSELLLLFIIGALLILGIKIGNNIYESYLVKNISLFEPNFLSLETDLSFKSETSIEKDEIKISMNELDTLEKIESKKVFEDDKTTNRYEVESDVVLTSVDSLPKDFNTANLEQSNYEETKKGGYRNNRYGRRKAYRVMMTSVNTEETKKKLTELLKDYDVKKVDNVKLGTNIPGGIYFNLFIPRNSLKEFLSKVSSLEPATILESRTSSSGPAGTDKVFIWVKSI